MDLQSLEKKLIYLKGIQAGIFQGSNPNVTKYKNQIDFEVSSLEKEFHKLNNQMNIKNNQLNIKNNQTNIQNNQIKTNHLLFQNKKEDIQEVEEIEDVVEVKEKIEDDINISKIKFLEVSKNINILKDKIFQNNNFIKLLNRNKTYQNSLKVQNIFKQNNQIQFQIQQNQQIYDLLNLKINNNNLYQKIYKKEENKPKSILKNTTLNISNSTKHIQINTDKNEIKEIPSNLNNVKKNIILQKKQIPNNHINNNNNHINNNHINNKVNNDLSFQNKRPEIKIEESDEDLMKEFQNTIGSLQKLLM